MSRCLFARSIDHVVLERGEIGNSWRTERWDSMRLLTPNWLSRLTPQKSDDPDAEGFATVGEFAAHLEAFARDCGLPIETHTQVLSVDREGVGYRVTTGQQTWHCRAIVVASGACNLARLPAAASQLPARIASLTAMQYRHPRQLDDGGVLIVGASATGVQLAEEIHRSGRPVTLSVGEHIRMCRTYRGRDIMTWMELTGIFDERYDTVDDIQRARRVPSLQLVGTTERVTLDLNALRRAGVRIVGRLAGIRDGKAQFSGSLNNQCALSDLKMGRLLDAIDRWIVERGLDDRFPPTSRPEPTSVDASPPLGLDFAGGEIRTILWATGYRPDYSWLSLPVLDRKGQIRHDGGVGASPGLYLMGMPFLRRRQSSLIAGAMPDAADLSAHLAAYLDRTAQ